MGESGVVAVHGGEGGLQLVLAEGLDGDGQEEIRGDLLCIDY
jgi:hypothetical protein